ncbi:hypothetical protein D3C87_89290 [compost metagenome]
MSRYVDVYLLPVPKRNLEKYRKMAKKAGKLFVKHGALSYREYVASDLKAKGMMPFPKLTKLKPSEALVYAAVEFKSEAHRNKSMARMFKDPKMKSMEPDMELFEMKRMSYGGFEPLVDL